MLTAVRAVMIAAAIAAPSGSKAPESKAPDQALTEAARKIPHQASFADIQRATARLGPAAMVKYSRCKAGSGECSDAPESAATSRIDRWMASNATTDFALLITSCRTAGGWTAGRVKVAARPRTGGKSSDVYDEIDARFFRETCWK